MKYKEVNTDFFCKIRRQFKIFRMKYKVVKYNTNFICRLRSQQYFTEYTSVYYLFLKEAFNRYKKIKLKKSRAAHPCQNKKCAYYSFKKAGSHPLALIQNVLGQNKKCANYSSKKAGPHPLALTKAAHTCQKINKKKNNYRYIKSTMSVGEYGYSIATTSPGLPVLILLCSALRGTNTVSTLLT